MAAAVLLKERNQHMCKVHTIVSTLLYAGHASKKVINTNMYKLCTWCHFLMSFQVHDRLNKLGISATHKTAMRTIKKLGNNHDADVLSWKESSTIEPDYIIVGDNVDKNVTPRDMRVGNQVKSLHYFHSYAVHDRVSLGSLSGDGHVSDVKTLAASAVFPTVGDCISIRTNYIVLAERVIVSNLSHFAFLQKCVTQHIPHKFSKKTAEKFVIVSALCSHSLILSESRNSMMLEMHTHALSDDIF